MVALPQMGVAAGEEILRLLRQEARRFRRERQGIDSVVIPPPAGGVGSAPA